MITATDLVEELVEKYPDLAAYLMKRGIVCIKCGEPVWGSIGELIRKKGQDVDQLLAELNDRFAANEPRK
jgi:methionine synthase II (cobalamin-independent)